MLKKVLAAFAALALVWATPAGATQKTLAQLTLEIATLFADNTTGAITPARLRTISQDIIDSTMYAIANGYVMANCSGSSNTATGCTGAAWLDQAFCNTTGKVLGRTSGGWNCKYQNVVDVTDFGAVGDNSTDNTTAIANAITALKARGSGTLYFPSTKGSAGPAIYRTAAAITLDADGIGVRCESAKGVIIRGTGNTNHGVYINGTQHNFVRDCSFDWAVTQICCGAGIFVNNAAFTYADNLHFNGPYHGVEIENTGLQTATKISNVVFEDCVQDSFAIGPTSTNVVNEVFLTNISTARCNQGMMFYYANGIYVTGYSAYQGAHSVVLAPVTAKTTSGIWFENSVFDSTSADAIAILSPAQGANGQSGDLYISNSQVDSNYQGLKIYDGAKFRGLQITNTSFDLNQNQAVYIGAIDTGPASSPSQADVLMSNNKFCLNSTSGAGNAPGVYFNSQGLVFTNNVSGLCGFPALNTQTGAGNKAYTTYGLQFGSSVDRAIVTSNRFPNNTTGGFNNGSAGVNIINTNNSTW